MKRWMQTLRRTAQLVKAQCSDVTRRGKPQKLHRLSKVLNSVASSGRSTNCCMAWKGAIPFVPATGENRKHVQTQVLVDFTSFQCNRGCKEGATQATPVSAKYSKLIAREAGLLMVKTTLVTISQEKCTNNEVSSEADLGVLQSCSQQCKINTDWSFGWVGCSSSEES